VTDPDPGSDTPSDERDPTLSEPVVVPHTELRPDLLRSVVESFVLREGTDYGEREVSLDTKIAHVVRQLERGEAQIIFDPQSESIDIVTRSVR
jgi:uncharacterized protein YheU (UPF0270 family)